MRNAVGGVQTAVLLGGTSEIGLAIAERLLDRGCASLVLAGRDLAACDAAARGLGAGHPSARIVSVAFDALDTDAHDAVVEEAVDAVGDVDLVIVAAGVLGDQADFEADPDAAVAAVSTNLTGSVSIMLRFLARFRRQGHGSFVVLSSVAGERVRGANYVYGSSKAGLDGFSSGLAAAVADEAISVLVVRPGFVHSRMTKGRDPAPFATTPQAVADDVIRGLERGTATVWSPSVLRWVMSGLRHLPRSVFDRLPG